MNGPFRFGLERVRAVRERSERLAKRELASAISELSRCEEELRTVDVDLERARTEQRSAVNGSRAVSGEELLARQAFVERIEARRLSGAEQVQRQAGEVAASDARLAIAAAEHETLERLRERRRAEHGREGARLEGEALDEIATVRFGRGAA